MCCLGKNLSSIQNKIEIFEHDYFFNYALSLYESYLHTDLKELNNLALVMLKPETIVMGKLNQTIEYFKSNGFKIIFGVKKYLSSCETSELWRYQWNAASLERIIATQKEFETYPCLVLLLESLIDDSLATSRMTNLKGSCFVSQRKPYHLRSLLSPINQALNYVHTADEPIDIVRELGIFLNADEFIRVMDIISSETRIEDLSFLNEYKMYKCEFDCTTPGEALEKILKNFYTYEWHGSSINISKIYDLLLNEVKLQKKNFSVYNIVDIFKQINGKIPWEFIVVLLTYIPYYNGKESIL